MARLTGLKAKILAEKYKDVLKKKGYAFFEKGNYNLNIVGVRNNSGRPDVFDDCLNLFYKISGEWVVDSYVATTEPGPNLLRWPLKSVRHKGAAILVPGQYRSVYQIGTHGGKRTYTALVQRGGQVEVYRDNNRDAKPDTDASSIERGMFGINIHRHWGPDEMEYIKGVSAGCQVFQSSVDFYEFMDTCNKAADIWDNSFTYTLLMESDVEWGI
tara:strand:+ start:8702 stop:9343 length:642 start_codon:yes stop_codon:yes gene_type:complete